MLPIIIAAIIGIQGWKPFIARIQQRQQQGAYKEWNKPPFSRYIRLLLIISLISIVLLVAWIITGAFNPTLVFSGIGILILFLPGLALLISSMILFILVLKK